MKVVAHRGKLDFLVKDSDTFYLVQGKAIINWKYPIGMLFMRGYWEDYKGTGDYVLSLVRDYKNSTSKNT